MIAHEAADSVMHLGPSAERQAGAGSVNYAKLLTRELAGRLAGMGLSSLDDLCCALTVDAKEDWQEKAVSILTIAGRLKTYLEGRESTIDWENLIHERTLHFDSHVSSVAALPGNILICWRIKSRKPFERTQLLAVDLTSGEEIASTNPDTESRYYGVWGDMVIGRFESETVMVWNPILDTYEPVLCQPQQHESVMMFSEFVYYAHMHPSIDGPVIRRVSLADNSHNQMTLPEAYLRSELLGVTSHGHILLDTRDCPDATSAFTLYDPQKRQLVDEFGSKSRDNVSVFGITLDDVIVHSVKNATETVYMSRKIGESPNYSLWTHDLQDQIILSPYSKDQLIVRRKDNRESRGDAFWIYDLAKKKFVHIIYPELDGSYNKPEHGAFTTAEGKLVVAWGDELLVYGDGRDV